MKPAPPLTQPRMSINSNRKISPQSIFALLGDAQVWMALAFLLDQTSKRAEVVATFRPPAAGAAYLDTNQLNIAHTCLGFAFELAYKSLLALDAGTFPKEHKLEVCHRKLDAQTRSQLEDWIKDIGWTSAQEFLQFADKNLTNPHRKYWYEPPKGENSQQKGFTLISRPHEIPNLTDIVRKMLERAHQELSNYQEKLESRH